jgi:hypothetical protein
MRGGGGARGEGGGLGEGEGGRGEPGRIHDNMWENKKKVLA